MKSMNLRTLGLAASISLLGTLSAGAQESAPASATEPSGAVSTGAETTPAASTGAALTAASPAEGAMAPAAEENESAEVPYATLPDEEAGEGDEDESGLEGEAVESLDGSESKAPAGGRPAMAGSGADTANSAASPVVLNRTPTNAPSGTAASVATSSTLFSVMLALVAVVVMIFGTAWFIKRFTGLSPLHNRQIKIVASLPVGARERVVLVEVGSEQLLLGVTPQQISHLHTLKEPLVTPDKPGNSDFAQRLQAMLSKGKPE